MRIVYQAPNYGVLIQAFHHPIVLTDQNVMSPYDARLRPVDGMIRASWSEMSEYLDTYVGRNGNITVKAAGHFGEYRLKREISANAMVVRGQCLLQSKTTGAQAKWHLNGRGELSIEFLSLVSTEKDGKAGEALAELDALSRSHEQYQRLLSLEAPAVVMNSQSEVLRERLRKFSKVGKVNVEHVLNDLSVLNIDALGKELAKTRGEELLDLESQRFDEAVEGSVIAESLAFSCKESVDQVRISWKRTANRALISKHGGLLHEDCSRELLNGAVDDEDNHIGEILMHPNLSGELVFDAQDAPMMLPMFLQCIRENTSFHGRILTSHQRSAIALFAEWEKIANPEEAVFCRFA